MAAVIRILLYSMIAVAVLIVAALWASMALSEDYWKTCEEAYQFCERQPYHRDCAIWTGHGQPLSVNRSYYPPVKPNPAIGTPFCVENPWHMNCGYLSEVPPMVHEHTECPIPAGKCKCKDRPPTYDGSGSSRSSTPAPCACSGG